MLSLFLIIFLNDMRISLANSIESDNSLPNYDFELPIRIGLEKQLRNKFAQKKKSEQILRNLNKQIAKDTEYFEDIPHFALNSSENIKSQEENVQTDFRHVIGMVGVKYTYKRDLHWRTWREVIHPGNKKKEVICYRCQNSINTAQTNCTHCFRGGYWVIEDYRPLCSYEIFSFKNKNELCGAYFWQLKKSHLRSCPSIISYEHLAHCDIPIITKFLIKRDYSKKVSERPLPAICQGRENCAISTVYHVNSSSIVFRIVNTTNNIIYSRIMKSNGENYACFDNCGIFDFVTKTATRNEDHLVLNLLKPPMKKKRHDHNHVLNKYRKINAERLANSNDTYQSLMANLEDAFENHESKTISSEKTDLFVKKDKYILEQPIHRQQPTHCANGPMCKHCKQLMIDFNDEK